MRRNGIHVRPATPDDAPVLARFADQVRSLPAGPRHGRPPASAEVLDRYEALLTNPARRVVLAVDDADTVLGMAVLSLDMAGELLDVPVVRVSHLVVDRAHRRRGAGRALVAAAASYAGELSVEHVSLGAATTDREANRFLARLGFAPVMVRRIAPVAVLSRHLALPESVDTPVHVVRRHSRAVRRALGRPRVAQVEDLA